MIGRAGGFIAQRDYHTGQMRVRAAVGAPQISHNDDRRIVLNNCDHMALGNRLILGFRECRKVNDPNGPTPLIGGQ
jgi:hypothetical protein